MGRRQTDLKTDSTGQYFRQIGRKPGITGQPKFRLGSDLIKAELAYAKLGALWQVVVAETERLNRGRQLVPADFVVKPEWSDATLAMANAIRQHLPSVRIGVPKNIRDASAYVVYLDGLRQQFGHIIHVIADDADAAAAGKVTHQHYADHRARQSRLNARIAGVPIPNGLSGTTLYQAIDQYAARSAVTQRGESARVEKAHALRLKHASPDMDLADFGTSDIERIKTYWASRPLSRASKKVDKPISLRAVWNHIAVARRFLRWLDRTDDFQWELPRHGLDFLKVNLQRLETPDETAGRRHGVRTFDVEQLAMIYAHATDLERLLLLLGLNCAMAQAEIITLRWDEIEGDPLTVKRVRRKSRVYGEFKLWPETASALAWWKALRPPQGPLVMITAAGGEYTRQRISNAWTKLRARIVRATGVTPTWWASFKHLRKTSAQFVQEASDGEIAAVMLSHGRPVASDPLADKYHNRPFPRVAKALDQVHARLDPVFRAVLDAFASREIGQGHKRRLSPKRITGEQSDGQSAKDPVSFNSTLRDGLA